MDLLLGEAYTQGKVVVISGPPTSDKEGILEKELASARDSGYKRDRNILLFRHLKDSHQPERIGEHDVDLVTESVDAIYEHIQPSTRHIVIAGAAHFQPDLAGLVDAIVRSNRNAILTTTNLDVKGRPYGCTPDLMTLATHVILTKGFCYKYGIDCNNTAANRSVYVNNQWEATDGFHAMYPDLVARAEDMGELILRVGPVKSGKSKGWRSQIQHLTKKDIKHDVFTPIKAARYGQPEGEPFTWGEVTFNDGSTLAALRIRDATDIEQWIKEHPQTKYHQIDEGNFVKGLYELALQYVPLGHHFDVTLLARGFNRMRFNAAPDLMCLADSIEMRPATCEIDGHPATESQRRIRLPDGTVRDAKDGEELEAPGGSDSGKPGVFYSARCLKDWKLEGEPENKYKLERYSPE